MPDTSHTRPGRGVRGAWALVGLVGLLACGRSPIAWWEQDSVDSEGSDDADPPVETTATTSPELACEGTAIYVDGFESGPGPWQLGTRWSVVETVDAFEGGAVLLGSWSDFDVGCSVQSSATLLVDLDAIDTRNAVLRLEHRGAACDFDALWIRVGAPGLPTIELREPTPSPDRWTSYTEDLSPWVGLEAVRIELGFENVCGDPCGVEWAIDGFQICSERG